MSRILSAFRWFARSLENPRRPLDPWSNAMGDTIEGSLSVAGVRVNRDKALTVSAVWRAVSLISRTVAKLPLGVYRHVRPGRERDADHPADYLLARCPCEGMTPFVWKQTLTGHVLLEGNAYAYIVRSGKGPCELWPLDPTKTYPVREARNLWYVHELKGGELRKLPAADVLHVKGMGFDGLTGYSVLSRAKESWGQAIATQAYSAVFFRNSARPHVILTHPGRLSPEARRNLRESWERMYSGLDNAHRTAVIEEGMVATPLQINARDSQLTETKQFSLVDVANWFNLPPHKLGANISTSYGSLEQENRNFLDDTIDPWLVAWEEECEAKLLSPYQLARDTHAVRFDRYPLVQADLQQRGEFYTKSLAAGWLSPDEVRAREGLNPMPGGLGKVYFYPTNLARIGTDPDGPGGPAVAPGTQLLDLPDLRQEGDYDCGPAAVQAVCQYFGRGPASRADYTEALGTTKRTGTRPAAVLDLLSRVGLVATAAGELDVEDLGRFFAAGQPVLCPVQWGDGPTVGHWVVVIGTGLGLVFVHDPAGGRAMLTEEDWLTRWHDRDADGVGYERYGIAVGEELLSAVAPAPMQDAQDDTGGDEGEGDDTAADSAGEAARAALLRSLGDALRRAVVRVGHQAVRAARRPESFVRWLDESLWQRNVEPLTAMLADPVAAYGAAVGRSLNADDVAGYLAADLRESLLRLAGEVTAAGLRPAAEAWAGKVDVWSLKVGQYLRGDNANG